MGASEAQAVLNYLGTFSSSSFPSYRLPVSPDRTAREGGREGFCSIFLSFMHVEK